MIDVTLACALVQSAAHIPLQGCLVSHRPAALRCCVQVTEQGAQLLEQVQLTPAAGKRSSSYSGGMKRRLSVALALLGSPQLVFLDEPSTGGCRGAGGSFPRNLSLKVC